MTQNDKNFDGIANHFAQKVYGNLKGDIRLAVLKHDLAPLVAMPPLRILDIGAGLGQMSLHFAKHGHHCTLSDISSTMLDYAKQTAEQLSLKPTIIASPYQNLPQELQGQRFDVILCHALIEWIATPQKLFAVIDELLTPTGWLSLCFYNPVSLTYRNLMMGNFNCLNHPKPSNQHSLTPNHPKSYDDILAYLTNYQRISQSGIRVFYDYTTHKRGGLGNKQAIIEMELRYSQQEPFWRMGRYLHILAKKTPIDKKALID